MRTRVRGAPSWPGHTPETGYVGERWPGKFGQLLEAAAGVFGSEPRSAAPAVDGKTLHAKIGELTLTNVSGALGKAGLLSAKR